MPGDLAFDVVADDPLRVGENPLWDETRNLLYWVGIYEGRLFRYDPDTDRIETRYDGDEELAAFTFQANGSLLLFADRGTVRVWRNNEGVVDTLASPGELTEARFNDVVTDPDGRVFCGTKGTDDVPGRLYRLDRDGTFASLRDGVELSNGLGFSPDLETLYYAESHEWTIHAFDYDPVTGDLSAARPFATFDEDGGFPDGLTVDADGDVWTALAYGGELARIAPDGSKRARYETPVEFPASVAFGGTDLDELYVTTGGGQDRETYGDLAGATLRCEPDAVGRAPFRSRVGLD
jgi:sugar lactone lactonase YvrE